MAMSFFQRISRAVVGKSRVDDDTLARIVRNDIAILVERHNRKRPDCQLSHYSSPSLSSSPCTSFIFAGIVRLTL